jgi:hypothetical protein
LLARSRLGVCVGVGWVDVFGGGRAGGDWGGSIRLTWHVAIPGIVLRPLCTAHTQIHSHTQLDASSLLELDDEELKVVASEVQDLKTRLGACVAHVVAVVCLVSESVDRSVGQASAVADPRLSNYTHPHSQPHTRVSLNPTPPHRTAGLVEDPSGSKVEWGALQAYVQESVEKIRKGVSFYVQGTKLLASDLQVRVGEGGGLGGGFGGWVGGRVDVQCINSTRFGGCGGWVVVWPSRRASTRLDSVGCWGLIAFGWLTG